VTIGIIPTGQKDHRECRPPLSRYLGLMFAVVQPILISVFALLNWLEAPWRSLASTFLENFVIGYLMAIPIGGAMCLVHIAIMRRWTIGQGRRAMLSVAVGVVLGAVVGTLMAFAGMPEGGSFVLFLAWPVLTGVLYGLLAARLEERAAVVPHEVPRA
jgi:hypothetical protein